MGCSTVCLSHQFPCIARPHHRRVSTSCKCSRRAMRRVLFDRSNDTEWTYHRASPTFRLLRLSRGVLGSKGRRLRPSSELHFTVGNSQNPTKSAGRPRSKLLADYNRVLEQGLSVWSISTMADLVGSGDSRERRLEQQPDGTRVQGRAFLTEGGA